MEYLDYSLEDFLADERFQQWVLAPEKTDSQFWENWLKAHPEKQPVVAQARQMLKRMAYNESPDVKDMQLDKLWQRIDSTRKIQSPVISPVLDRNQKPAPRQIWMLPQYQRIAAVFVMLLIGTIILYKVLQPVDFVEHSTAYGKTKPLFYPTNQ